MTLKLARVGIDDTKTRFSDRGGCLHAWRNRRLGS